MENSDWLISLYSCLILNPLNCSVVTIRLSQSSINKDRLWTIVYVQVLHPEEIGLVVAMGKIFPSPGKPKPLVCAADWFEREGGDLHYKEIYLILKIF